MDLFTVADRHLRALLLLVALLVAAGSLAALSLPVGLFPNVTFPRVAVKADAAEMPPDQMAIAGTRPLEEAIAAVPGVGRMRSVTSRGSSEVSVGFPWGTDMLAASLLVQSAVNQAQALLPPGTRLEVRRMDPTVFPVIGYSLTAPTRAQTELRDLAYLTLRPLIMRVPGVARVTVVGGARRELRVTADPAKLRARGVTPQALADAVARVNAVQSGGFLESGYQLFLTVADARATSAEAIAALPVATAAGGQPVAVGDVATVEETGAPRWTRVRADGREAVLMNVYQQPGGNTLAVDAGVREALGAAAGLLPADVRLAKFYDQGELIAEAMSGVRDAIGVGVVLGVAVIALFLRRWRLTALAAAVVPASVAVTVLGLQALELSFNVMTLGGLAAAVGLILDDAIVMLEHVSHHLEAGEPPAAAAANATRELAAPFLASSLCSLVVFVPLAFLTGVTGAFFRSLSLTMGAALVVSLALCLVLLPPLAARVLSRRDVPVAPAAGWPARAYEGVMRALLPRPGAVALVGAAMCAGGLALYSSLPNGFLPVMDEGAFILDYVTPPGTSLAQTERLLARIEGVLARIPEVSAYSRRTGFSLSGSVREPNEGDFLVKLRPMPRRTLDEVVADVRARVEAEAPGVRAEFAQLMEDLIGDLTDVPQPIEIKVLGDDQTVDEAVARRIAAAIGAVPGVVDVFEGITITGPSFRVATDPVAAGRLGVSAGDVGLALRSAVGGLEAGGVVVGEQVVPVRVQLGASRPVDAAALAAVPVPLAAGGLVALGDVARVTAVPGAAQITRENLKRMVAVTARIEDQSLGGTVDRIKALLAREVRLPPGVSLEYGGLYAEQQASFEGLLRVCGAAFALVALVLVIQFRSVGAAAAILAIDLVSLFGVLLALWLTGTALNVSSMMGAVMIIGIVAENAVFYLHTVEGRRRAGLALDDALMEAGLARMRPVVMTTLAAVLALLPLALGLGAGAQLQRPLAIAVIGGFALSSVLILVALPVVYRSVART